MSKYTFLFVSVSFLLVSCTYFTKQPAINTTAIDSIIDFESVDAFPLFPSCDSIPSRSKQKVCFQIKIAEFIHNELQKHAFTVPEQLQDTALVKINISNIGKAQLDTVILKQESKVLLPQLDSILKLCIEEIPQMKPAIKRSFPVATVFTLPVVISN